MFSTGSPDFLRPRIFVRVRRAQPPTTIANRIHPASGDMLAFMILRMFGSSIPIVPPSPMMSRITPCNARNAAKVTTKLGMPSLATSRPISRPMMTPVSRVAPRAIHSGQPRWVKVTPSIAAQVPAA